MIKKIAIMQPYLFPYLGYFQLLAAVDVFVFYDDVNFIKGGWIQRNYILSQEKKLLFSIPLKKSSSNKDINDIQIDSRLYGYWNKKFLKTLEQNYKKAPHFDAVYPMVENLLNGNYRNISEMAANSITVIKKYLNLEVELKFSSNLIKNNNKKGETKVIEICKTLNISNYINPYGGKSLYNKDYFSKNSVELSFIKSKEIKYKQFGKKFEPNLSIIDVLMFNSKEEVKEMLNSYILE